MVTELDNVLFKYVSHANPKSNVDLKRFLRLYPSYRQEIIEFTATWRALSILEWVQPTADPIDERLLLQHVKMHVRTLQRRRASPRLDVARAASGLQKHRRHATWTK